MSFDAQALILNDTIKKIDFIEKGQRIGLCPQNGGVYDHLTVEENLLFMSRVKGLTLEEF